MNYIEETEFSFYELNEVDVIEATNDVKLASVAGGDGVTACMARFTGRAMASLLTTIFNISLRYATFPTAWKTGLITPVFKAANLTWETTDPFLCCQYSLRYLNVFFLCSYETI